MSDRFATIDSAGIFQQFVAAINSHDVETVTSLMTVDHVFVDSLGNQAHGATSMEAGWRGYFAMCPDYRIQTDDVMAKKLESYGASYIEAVANKHNRNADWARSAVRESASITSEKALELKVVDIIARDLPDLLAQLDGRLVNGRRLATAGAGVAAIPLLARERLFQMLWRPEVMFVLMLIAVYGIIG